MRTLFVSGFLPSPRVPSGGQQLVYRALQEKAARGPVSLLGFCNEQEHMDHRPEDVAFCRRATVLRVTPAARWRAALLRPSWPLVASARYALGARPLAELLRSDAFDAAWFEFVQAAALLELLPPDLPSTLVVHDLFHQAIARRARRHRGGMRLALLVEASRTRRWEREVLRRPHRLVTLTDKDRDAIRVLTGRTDVVVRYPQVSEAIASVRRSADAVTTHEILFFGQMSRTENADGVQWFAREILPRIQREIPQARLRIAGARPGPEVQALSSPSIAVTGFVADPREVLARAHIAVAPLRLGSGVKIKVIEYLAAGIPTVATPIGAEGVAPHALLHVAESEDRFARTCIQLLTCPA